MPAICARSSVRPGCSVSSTEALGFCCSRKKPFWFGSARCTRAACTAASAVIERVSSPSSPRWKVSRSWNWVWPKRAPSISSKPTTRPLGRPAEASLRRTSCTLSAGTRIAAPPSAWLVGHVHLRQLRDDGAAVLVGQVGVQHLVVALAAPHRHGEHHARPARRCPARAQLALRRAGRPGGRRNRRVRPGADRALSGDGVVHGRRVLSRRGHAGLRRSL